MTARAGAGVSTRPDPLAAGVEAANATAQQLGRGDVDFAVVFASGTNLRAPEAVLEGVRSVLAPGALVGCAAGGVLGAGRELEGESAVSVWAARFSGTGDAETFHLTMGDDARAARRSGEPSEWVAAARRSEWRHLAHRSVLVLP